MKPLFLLVDDNAGKREFLRSFIQKQIECELLEATNTDEAKQLIVQHVEIAAAFVDYNLPTENGPAVMLALKHHNPNCLVACVSSSDNPEQHTQAKAAGAEAYICTSHDWQTVERNITNLLGEWQAQVSMSDS